MAGGSKVDIVRAFQGHVINFFKKRAAICTGPCDGLILKMHYQWTFWILIGIFYAVWFSWFQSDVITCVSHFDASTAVRMDYVNICLSYPFLEHSGKRRYILYYRWIPFAFLLLAGLYYIPRKLSKSFDNGKTKKLFEDLCAHQLDTDERQLVERAALYTADHWNTHNGLFFKYLACNITALAIDAICFFSLDFLLQGRFKTYGLSTYPFKRDVETFKDYMSQTFPPFVMCELGPTYKLTNKRTETLGCHLIIMEFYEKLFFVLWYWLVSLMSLTSLYIIYLFFMRYPLVRRSLLKVWKPITARHSLKVTLCKLVNNCKIGDFYILYRLKEYFSHAGYYELLIRLANPSFTNGLLEGISIDNWIDEGNNMRQRCQGQPKKQTGRAQGRFFGNPNSQALPNSSILVE